MLLVVDEHEDVRVHPVTGGVRNSVSVPLGGDLGIAEQGDHADLVPIGEAQSVVATHLLDGDVGVVHHQFIRMAVLVGHYRNVLAQAGVVRLGQLGRVEQVRSVLPSSFGMRLDFPEPEMPRRIVIFIVVPFKVSARPKRYTM